MKTMDFWNREYDKIHHYDELIRQSR